MKYPKTHTVDVDAILLFKDVAVYAYLQGVMII